MPYVRVVRELIGSEWVNYWLAGSNPVYGDYGSVCLVARARDCKSPTKIHRRFESYPAHYNAYVSLMERQLIANQ